MAGMARRGMARLGKARHGRRGEAWRGMAWLGLAGIGQARLARLFYYLVTRRGCMQIDSIRWKSQFPSRGVSAKVAYETLEMIREKSGGKLTDDIVVASAKSKRSAIHPLFEWDDNKAAIEHRRSQARSLIRGIEITYKESPKNPVRAFQIAEKAPVKQPERSVYKTTEDVMNDPTSRDALIAQAIRDAMAFRRRFRHLHELSPLFDALDQIIESTGLEVVAS